MMTNDEILSQIEYYLAQCELPYEPELLYSPIRYSLTGGGKRIRPMLTLLCNNLFSENINNALPAAAAIEVFHNFTLLHDDIMDNSAIRRGKPSVHAKWGRNVAILSGDAMLIYAYKLLSVLPSDILPRVLEIFNSMALSVCEGQQYDMDFERRQKVAVVEYTSMIELKTSVLLGGAAMIGALIGGGNEQDAKRLYKFAIELGLAFQIQDDMLDSYGDEELGKPIGGDILEGKQTYLMITAMSRADEPRREILRKTHSNPELSNEQKIALVRGVYDELGIPKLAEQQISVRFERAISLLDMIQVDASRKEPLRQFAQSLINRKK